MPPRAFMLAAVLWSGAASGTSQELAVGLQASFEEGVAALKAGQLEKAEAAFKAVLKGGGDLAFVHNNLAIVHQERGRHLQAVAEFREATRLDSRYLAPRVGLGASLGALGRWAEAARELREAVRLAPREPLARAQLARACEQTRDWAGAIEQYRALREIAPKEAEYAYGLGRAYLRLSEWCLGELRGLPSGQARLEQALGHNYRAQGRADLALRAFERAARADPALPEIHLALAQIHMEEGRWADARQEIEAELVLVPESAGARALQERLRVLETRTP